MQVLGGAAVLAGPVVGAILTFVKDENFEMATLYAAGGAMLSFFGFIHSSTFLPTLYRLPWS